MKNNILGVLCAAALSVAVTQPNPAQAQGAKPVSTTSLAEMKNQLTALQGRIASTINNLQQVKESSLNESALKKAAADFTSQYSALEAQMETVRKEAVATKATANAHFDSWQKELTSLQSAKIREKAQSRFTESKKEFEKIITEATYAKDKAVPFVSDLKDIMLFLEADLSADAVKSLSNTIWKLGNRSKSVNSSIEDVKTQIDRTIKSLPTK